MLPVYRPSGVFGPAVLAAMVPLAAAAAAIGGGLGAASWFNRYIIVKVLILVAMMWGAAWAAKRAVKLGRCRRVGLGAAMGALAAAVAVLASHYAAYLLAAKGAAPPSHFLEFLVLRSRVGSTIGRASLGAWWVWSGWGFEAVLTVLAGVAGGAAAAAEPFCERCGRWADRTAHEFGITGLSEEAVGRIRAAETLEPALSPPLEEIRPDPRELRYRVRECPACGLSAFLDLKLVTTRINRKGERETSEEELGGTVVLSPEEAAAVGELRRDLEELREAPADPL